METLSSFYDEAFTRGYSAGCTHARDEYEAKLSKLTNEVNEILVRNNCDSKTINQVLGKMSGEEYVE